MNKLWAVLFGVVIVLEFVLFPLGYFQGWWLPKNVASTGGEIDLMFYGILAVTGLFFVGVEFILVWIMFAYPAEPGRKVPFIHGIFSLEIIWTLIPGVILLVIALWQINVWAEVKYPTRMQERMTPEAFNKDQIQILAVTARQWEWRVRYPDEARMANWKQEPRKAQRFASEIEELDVRTVNEVHVWKGADVFVQLGTQDVLHSFFLPNLRVKQDAVPGKTIPVWFVATESNTARNPETGQWQDGYDPQSKQFGLKHQVWELACAEFCGSRHSMMRGKLFVHETREDFLEWLREAQKKNQQREKE